MEFEARILWHSARWLSFIKWPSSNEVDFGDFVVKFDFSKGVAEKVYVGGRRESLATYAPVESKQGLLGIRGAIEVKNHVLEFQLKEDESGIERCVISEISDPATREQLEEVWVGKERFFRFKERLMITPRNEAGRVILSAQCEESYAYLAIVLACFLVFNRYVEDVPPAGGEFD
ncbi:hypothetical protein [Rubritalea sp.]|uniref:hypothetical protein n=1 Tax=Rubritalea sp. TaxID=2109375 RepID=UPI003EF9CD2A